MAFSDSLKNGTIGEYVAWCFFNSLSNVKELIDVRADKKFQAWDIDFLLLDTDRQLTFVEVKTDSKAHETGNFVYETKSNNTYNTIGCFDKTKAEMIAYYVVGSKNLYLLNVHRLREFVKTFDLRSVKMGDNATGYLLPIAELERFQVITGMYNVGEFV